MTSEVLGGVLLHDLLPLLNGVVPDHTVIQERDRTIWRLADGGHIRLERRGGDEQRWQIILGGFPGERRIASLGLRLTAANARQYLRCGYMSWDGSFLVEPDAARAVAAQDERLTNGYAMTALLPYGGPGAAVIGFLRHDRYQSRLRFSIDGPLRIDIETLIDLVPHEGEIAGEEMALFTGPDLEAALRHWAGLVGGASPLPPRLPGRRLTGWCSWYNLYASLSEPVLVEHLEAARRFRDQNNAAFDIFQIDDGFTPEMGDWLDMKPQFPGGIRPILDRARDAGFIPGLWIAPFMVGNRSRLSAEHPDWVVRNRKTGRPLSPMTFHGEFRWHKRSEEYHVLDITHPDAEAYIRQVFRLWAKDWGCGYFKTDFMHLGSTYGPEEAVWHQDGLSRMEVWMRMARLIREEIGDALWLLCGAPLWAPVGLVDAVRVGRDVGVTWAGNHSAESLLRDQTTRNFANGILWQSDPDCILLRDRFHALSDDELHSLAMFAGLTGGVLMTSDQLDEVPGPRRKLLAELAGDGAPYRCDFPLLGQTALRYRMGTLPDGRPLAIAEGDPVLVQRVTRPDGSVWVNVFNTGDAPAERLLPWSLVGKPGPLSEDSEPVAYRDAGVPISLRPHQSRLLQFDPPDS